MEPISLWQYDFGEWKSLAQDKSLKEKVQTLIFECLPMQIFEFLFYGCRQKNPILVDTHVG